MKSLLALVLLLFGTVLSAQPRIVLSTDSLTAAFGETVCFPVVADSFPGAASVQFSLKWDNSLLVFDEVRFGANPLDLSSGSANMPNPDEFVVSFTTDDALNVVLDPGTQLFELCFTNQLTEGTTPLTFGGRLLPEFFNDNLAEVPFDTLPGALTTLLDVSTGEPAWGRDLRLFPNPLRAGHTLQLGGQLPDLRRIDVFSAAGARLATFPGGQRALPLAQLPPGAYTVRLVAAGGVVSRLFVRE